MGALVEPMSVAYHAAVLGEVNDQSRALIYGAGPIGIGLWFALRGMGLTEIDVVEPSPTRRTSIEALGARTLDPTAVDVPGLIADRTNGDGVDAAFDAAGVAPAVESALECVGERRPLISVAIYDKPLTDPTDQSRSPGTPHPGHHLLHRRRLPRRHRPDGPRPLRHHRLGRHHPDERRSRAGLRGAPRRTKDETARRPDRLTPQPLSPISRRDIMTVAHVTGAARGIGKAIALRLAQDGHDVAVSDLPSMKDELDVTRKELEDIGVRAAALTGDVSDPDSVRRLVADTASELGSLDVFVANAGIAQTKALLDVTPEEYDKVHAVNGRGVFLCYTEAARQMIKQGTGGKIIGACSIAGHKGFRTSRRVQLVQVRGTGADPVRGAGMGRTRHHRQRLLPRHRGHPHVGRGRSRLGRHQQSRRRRVDESHGRRHHTGPRLHRRGRRRVRVLPGRDPIPIT